MLDDLNREGLGIEVDFSRPAERVVRSLNPSSGNGPPDRFPILLHIEWHGKPLSISVDNGPEYVSSTLMNRAEKQGIVGQAETTQRIVRALPSEA